MSKLQVIILRPAAGPSGFLSLCNVKLSFQNSSQNFSSKVQLIDESSQAFLKKGRGGRSSFNGIVATVFGATGYTGSAVCNRLGKIGTQLIIPYRCDPYYVQKLKLCGDLGQVLFQPLNHVEDEENICNAVKYSNVVVNLIGREFETKNFTFNQANVESAARIARISKEMGVKKFIQISALNCQIQQEGIFKSGGSQFLRTKASCEVAVKKAFPEAVILRPSDIWGNIDSFISPYFNQYRRFFAFVGLTNGGVGVWKQPVHLGDFAEAIARIATNPDIQGKTYEIIGSRRYELCDLVKWFYDSVLEPKTIIDAKYDPTIWIRATINECLPMMNSIIPFKVAPISGLTFDKLEREGITDITTGLPNLTDLGIEPTNMEEMIEYQLWPFFRKRKFLELGLFEKAVPPKYVEASRIL